MEHPRFLRLKQVVEMTSLNISTIYRVMKKGKFPRQRKIAERSTRWVESEVLDYIKKVIDS